jgi:hypothetical protein
MVCEELVPKWLSSAGHRASHLSTLTVFHVMNLLSEFFRIEIVLRIDDFDFTNTTPTTITKNQSLWVRIMPLSDSYIAFLSWKRVLLPLALLWREKRLFPRSPPPTLLPIASTSRGPHADHLQPPLRLVQRSKRKRHVIPSHLISRVSGSLDLAPSRLGTQYL